MSGTVVIVGRPNVGKSTLFNRLIGRKLALVADVPGVTRDRREGQARLGDLRFRVIDTAGLEEASEESLAGRMRRQTEAALSQADVALFMIDAKAGIIPMDRHFADWLRRSGKPVVLVANKAEGRPAIAAAGEAFAFGFGQPILLSAEHGEGLADLYDALAPYLTEGVEDEPSLAPDLEDGADGDTRRPLALAIVGRPNVGKSTLVNHLLGEERVLTGPEPGITRDAIAIEWRYKGRAIRLVDTAGMRRRARVQEAVEKMSVGESLRAIRLAEVVVLVIDAAEGLDKQDLTIADHALTEGRGLVIAVNKWDLVEDRARRLAEIESRLEASLAQVKGLPVVTLSARTGRHVDRLMPAILDIHERWGKRVPTPDINRWLREATERHPPPAVRGRHLRLRYAVQIKSRPPTFVLFTSQPATIPDAYLRYLANSLRSVFNLDGIPVRLILRRSKNPYAEDGR